MRYLILILAVILVAAPAAFATPEQPEIVEALPASPPGPDKSATVLQLYTFDNGGNPDPQGWTTDDLTENPRNYCHVDNFLPALVGTKSMWCGAVNSASDPETADWVYSGYGDRWHQSWESRDFVAPVAGNLDLTYTIAWQKEPNWDLVHLEYRVDGSDWFTGRTYTSANGSETYTLELLVPAGASVRYRFRFESDFAHSNEDGDIVPGGAFQLDEIALRDANNGIISYENFEAEAIGAETTLSGDWQGVIVTGFGDYTALASGSQVRQDDGTTYNAGHFWSFFSGSADQYDCGADPQAAVPVGGDTYFERIDNQIRSPWVELDLNAGPRSVRIGYDVYLDMDYDPPNNVPAAHQVIVHYRDLAGNDLGQDVTPYYVGEFKAWFYQQHQFNLPESAAEVQVVFELKDIFGTDCNRHAPLIDNVRISQTTAFTVTRGLDTGDETLRWAILAANDNPGPDIIDISVLNQTAITVDSPLPIITETVELDGFVQIGSRPNTLTGASDAVLRARLVGNYAGAEPAIDIQADGCVVSGFSVTDFAGPMIKIVGDQNVVRGCWLGFDADGEPQAQESDFAVRLIYDSVADPFSVGNRIGGPDPADQNVMGRSLNAVCSASRHDQLVIQGNLVGLAPDGVTAAGGRHGISVSSVDMITILDNVVSGNTGIASSAGLDLNSYTEFVVQGNIIGLSGDQMSAVPNAGAGVEYNGNATTALIGGCGPGQGNIIAGNGATGVSLQGSGVIKVIGNTIGTNETGTRQDLGNGGDGVLLTAAEATLFGVGEIGCGNLIAHNDGDGVKVTVNFAGSYEILSNEIHDNGGLEINVSDFDDYAPSPPVLSDVYLNRDRLTATVTLADSPNVTRELNFFISRQCNDPTDPQAEIFLVRGAVVTDGRGEATVSLDQTGIFFPGDVLTATSTAIGEATSGLSPCSYLVNTRVGTNVVVPLPDQTGTSFPMTVTYDEVIGEGITFGQPGQDTGAPPPEYVNHGIYQFATTVWFGGGLEICIDYDDSAMGPGTEADLQLLQMDMWAPGNEWFDITTSFDPANNRICGQIGALGQSLNTCFALVTPDGPSAVPTPQLGLRLLPNVPNPFNPSTEITYVLPRDGEPVTVDIYDLAGRHVRRLFAGQSQAGSHSLIWNGADDKGRTVVSGVYPLRLLVGKEVRLQRLVLVK